jgi:AraC-like DNA-binding protein/ligand-binding sensor protein
MIDKALKMMAVYTQATGSEIRVYDHGYRLFPESPVGRGPAGKTAPPEPNKETGAAGMEETICRYCVNRRLEDPYPCHGLHMNAIREANRRGGSHIYRCELGFTFWTSPLFDEGSFAGALRGSGFTAAGPEEKADGSKSFGMCNKEIPPEEFLRRLKSFPAGDDEKIQSLAEMLLLCAETLSSGSEDYFELLRRRAEQQQAISSMIGELKAKYPAGSILPGYPLEKERQLITAIRQGDRRGASHILNELLAMLIFVNPGHFKYIQLRATELVVLLSRADINGNSGGNHTLEDNSGFLKRIQDAKSIEELTDILHTIVERVTGLISSFKGIPHAAALRKAERFILENFTRKISLKEIADIAGLSPPYFSTIFKEEMGENLSKYLNRLRVDRASHLLLETNLSLSEIAGACCFEDQSWFSKIFKSYTGLSPGKYRNQGGGTIREISENNLSEDYLKTIKSP